MKYHCGVASDPGQIRLSLEKFRSLEPLAAGLCGEWAGRCANREEFEERLDEHIQVGDSRAACVIAVEPLLVAAYTDELDCVAVLCFPNHLVSKYNLSLGARLLTVNTYQRSDWRKTDLVLGPRQLGQFLAFWPIIADFVSEDSARLQQRKNELDQDEWARTCQLGREYVEQFPGRTRDGRPSYSDTPAALGTAETIAPWYGEKKTMKSMHKGKQWWQFWK